MPQTVAVLGVYLGNDLSACLVRGGEIEVLIEEERLTRVQTRPALARPAMESVSIGYIPWASISYCLDAAEIIDDLDLIVFGDRIWAEAARQTIAEIIPIRPERKIVFADYRTVPLIIIMRCRR